MRRQTVLAVLIILSLLATTLVANPTVIRAVPPAANMYHDPAGQFTVLIPTNWKSESKGTYGLLTDPDGKITVYVLATKGSDIQEAVAGAWKTVDPNATYDLAGAKEVISSEGIEKTVRFTFVGKDPQQAVTATAKLYQGNVYSILIKADLKAAEYRASQLNVITTGLGIPGLKLVDLKEVKALPVDREMTAKLETFINENMAKLGIPGMEVAIVQNGKIVYAMGFGVRQKGSKEPVTPQTMMMIGSVTKSMTSMMMATVVDDGKMSWDTPAVSIMPQFALSDSERTKTLVMRNLVCACTGIERHDLEFIFRGKTLSPTQIIGSLATFPIVTKLGEAYHYNNQLVAAAGYAAAIAAGGSYGRWFLRKHVQRLCCCHAEAGVGPNWHDQYHCVVRQREGQQQLRLSAWCYPLW
jgi:hypothetical protein